MVPAHTRRSSTAPRVIETLCEMVKGGECGDVHVFQTKDLMLENNSYRLDFYGRVNTPSITNFQMTSAEDLEHDICVVDHSNSC